MKTITLIFLYLISFNGNFYLYSQENYILEAVLNGVTNKKEYIQLADYYHLKNDSVKYNALIYLLENINQLTHTDYILNPNNTIKKRILLTDSLYFNLVSDKTYEDLKTKAIQDSIEKIGRYIQSIPWADIDENQDISYEDSPLINLSASKIKEHIDHCFFLRKNSPILKTISDCTSSN